MNREAKKCIKYYIDNILKISVIEDDFKILLGILMPNELPHFWILASIHITYI